MFLNCLEILSKSLKIFIYGNFKNFSFFNSFFMKKVHLYTITGQKITLDINQRDCIKNLKKKLEQYEKIPTDQLSLVYQCKELADDYTLLYYSINDDSKIQAILKSAEGSCQAENMSRVVGFARDDHEIYRAHLECGRLGKLYIRNSCVTGVYDQGNTETCYAHASCSAYINAIHTIPGSRHPPSFADCFQIAKYRDTGGGYVTDSLTLLENHFHYGIKFQHTKELPEIREVLTTPIIFSFTTSNEGWERIKHGSLVEKPPGDSDGWHSVLLEGYDLERDVCICKNSWGGITAEPRFECRPSATCNYRFVKLYWTLESIQGKNTYEYNPIMRKCIERLDGRKIDAAWMDKKTADYCTDYVCEYHPEKEGDLKYLGYDIEEWIKININRR